MKKFAYVYSLRIPKSLEGKYLFAQFMFLYAFYSKLITHSSFKDTKCSCCYVFNEFLLVCEIILFCLRGSELFFFVFGLVSLS